MPTNQTGVVLSWPAQSVTPAGDLVIVPQFQVQRSADLRTWSALGPALTGPAGGRLTLVDSNGPAAFYRVQSFIQMEYAQLDSAQLGAGQLQGADFFGANLFGATFTNATLSGASLAGADLRSADLSDADLTGRSFRRRSRLRHFRFREPGWHRRPVRRF